jgi:hypothetical protein
LRILSQEEPNGQSKTSVPSRKNSVHAGIREQSDAPPVWAAAVQLADAVSAAVSAGTSASCKVTVKVLPSPATEATEASPP